MKIIHLSDLHLGKRVNEFSMLEDQQFILTKIINIIDEQKPDGVIIAGDVYDKSVPSAEAVELFDDFLVRLSKRDLKVFVISGNHDSAERIAFGGRLMQGSELLAGCGQVLNSAAAVSGAVPQISVVLGTCLGTNALNAVSADFVIMSEKAQLSLDVTGKNSSAEYNAEHGIAAVVAKDTAEAVAKAKELVLYLPSNNLNTAPESFEEEPGGCNCIVGSTVDGGSVFKLFNSYGTDANVRFARLGGSVVGIVRTKGGLLSCSATTKIAKFVRFCDAFSLPVLTFVDCKGFESIKSAAKAASAYAEATTVKISVICGQAVGSGYIALAGTGANADMVYALPEAVVSPVNVEAAAFILAADEMNVNVSEQKAVAEKFAAENLSAFNAAQNGYVDGIVEAQDLRKTLISALDMLAGKRVPTVAKKHSTI